MRLDALHALSVASLRALATSLLEGPLSAGVTRVGVQQIAGVNAAELEACLVELKNSGFDSKSVALGALAIAEARQRAPDPSALFELVLSGPDLPGVPTSDTAATMRSLVAEAQSDVLLVGYAVHNGKALFERLAARLAATPALKVRFCLDVRRRHGDTSLDSEIVRRFGWDFRERHWPWPQVPEVYYDPRALLSNPDRASLHAKCILVDRRAALITSANFTEAAHNRNIEAGLLVRHAPYVTRLCEYFEGLIASGRLVRCPLADKR